MIKKQTQQLILKNSRVNFAKSEKNITSFPM